MDLRCQAYGLNDVWVSERESSEIPARGRIAAKQFEETVVIV